MVEVLLSSHYLDTSMPPGAAEQTILQHIFQAHCFVDMSSSTSHCSMMQTNFNNPQIFLTQIYQVLFAWNPTKTQLELYFFGNASSGIEVLFGRNSIRR